MKLGSGYNNGDAWGWYIDSLQNNKKKYIIVLIIITISNKRSALIKNGIVAFFHTKYEIFITITENVSDNMGNSSKLWKRSLFRFFKNFITQSFCFKGRTKNPLLYCSSR